MTHPLIRTKLAFLILIPHISNNSFDQLKNNKYIKIKCISSVDFSSILNFVLRYNFRFSYVIWASYKKNLFALHMVKQ